MNSAESEEVQSKLELPHLPDMLFIHNHLDLVHKVNKLNGYVNIKKMTLKKHVLIFFWGVS